MTSNASRRRRATGVLAVFVLSLALAACSSGSSDADADSETPIVVGVSALGTKWGTPDSGQDGTLFGNLHAGLVRKAYVAADGDYVGGQDVYSFEPYLAESYDVSDDGLVYTFHLRDDVESSSGNALTADDVVYSYERKFASPAGTTIAVTAPVLTSADQVQKVDDATISITIPSASFGTQLLALLSDYTGGIYDSTLLKEHETADDPYAIEWSDTEPNYGFGPYVVDDYREGQYIDYVKNPGFPADLGTGAERFRYTLIADAGTQLSALRAGDIDIAMGLLPADVSALESEDGITVPLVETPNEWLLIPTVTTSAPFDNVAVRQALAYAIPYDELIDSVYYGRASKVEYGPISTQTPGYSSDGLEGYNYDIDRAKELLAEAGYSDGVSFTLTIDSSRADLEAAAILIQTRAAEAGFDISIEKVSNAALWEGITAKSFQAFMMRDYAITQTQSYVMRLFTQPGSFANLGNWEDDEYYAAEEAAEAVPDQLSAEAGAEWAKAEAILLEQFPINYALQIQPTVAYASDISGYVWRTDNYLDLTQITRE
ncbi:MAG TPA: ABC transporter substrate-binding protein [Thermomicrobiales bacterium]|nr:ABC transporter substrate-binding protein [Thermomicrobiales bacterium]